MNFSISKTVFNEAIQVVNRAISPNSPQAPLRGIKLSLTSDSLTLVGSDADISIQKVISKDNENAKLVIVEEGELLIDVRYLSEIVRKIDSDTIKIEVIDGTLTRFSGNKAEFKINCLKASDYPQIDFSKPEVSVTFNNDQLKEIIAQTSFATSQKETRPILTGVNFKLENNTLTCTGTDSYRLAKKTLPFESEHSFNITIPSKSLEHVYSTMLEDKGTIDISTNDKKIQFVNEAMVLQARLLDGGYPDTDRLIPNEFNNTLSLAKDDLIASIDRTMFIKNDNMIINRLQCSQDEVILTNKSQEIGESMENLDGTYEGEPLDISFSGLYVMNAAKALKGKQIKIKFTSEMKPFILSDENDDSVIQLVLPVRTYN